MGVHSTLSGVISCLSLALLGSGPGAHDLLEHRVTADGGWDICARLIRLSDCREGVWRQLKSVHLLKCDPLGRVLVIFGLVVIKNLECDSPELCCGLEKKQT